MKTKKLGEVTDYFSKPATEGIIIDFDTGYSKVVKIIKHGDSGFEIYQELMTEYNYDGSESECFIFTNNKNSFLAETIDDAVSSIED